LVFFSEALVVRGAPVGSSAAYATFAVIDIGGLGSWVARLSGLTLGGGINWLMRKYGLTIDQLLSVDLITADGEFFKASASENEDLFWGVRGGGGNFGIVTEFEFRINPVGPIVLAGPIFWPIEEAPNVLRVYREWISETPDELMTIVTNRKAPPLSFVPLELHGKLIVGVACCYAGPLEEGAKVVKPLKVFGSPVLDVCVPKPFLAHQAMFDPSFPHGRWYYIRSCDVAQLTDEVIDITVDHALQINSPFTALTLWQRGGAVARVGEDETAFGGRIAGHTYIFTGATEGSKGFDEERQWVRSFWSALEPYHTSVYVNFHRDHYPKYGEAGDAGDEGGGPPSTISVMARATALGASLLVAFLFVLGRIRRSKGWLLIYSNCWR
jgi:hypothetical protein